MDSANQSLIFAAGLILAVSTFFCSSMQATGEVTKDRVMTCGSKGQMEVTLSGDGRYLEIFGERYYRDKNQSIMHGTNVFEGTAWTFSDDGYLVYNYQVSEKCKEKSQ